MKKLFTHENRMIIFNLKNVLEAEGISTIIMNEYASGGVGNLSAFDTWPELWVEDDTRFDKAASIVDGIRARSCKQAWFCRKCGEENDPAFELCWNCAHPFG